jgi:hypothetical protein
MKLCYTEDLLKDVIEKQIFPHAPAEVAAFSLDHLAIGYLKKTNGEKSRLNCILGVNEYGILAVFMGNFRIDKATGFKYLEFSKMQGIKVKKSVFFYYITLQFIDGTNYVFQIMKRNNKHLPNQHRNIQYIISVLDNQNLNDMPNSIYKKRVIQGKIMESIYIMTLLSFEIIMLILLIKYASDSIFLILVSIILTAIVHFILFLVAALYLDIRKGRHFAKEYNHIIKAYRETDNAETFLSDLSSMENPPKTAQSANVFHYSMSTALHKNNRKEEALSYLDKVDTSEKDFQKVVEEQRELIEDGEYCK